MQLKHTFETKQERMNNIIISLSNTINDRTNYWHVYVSYKELISIT